MDNLIIEQTGNNPAIEFDAGNGILSISGRSILSDAKTFFDPVIDWIKEYVKNPAEKTTVIFNLDYFNSSTAMKLVRLLSYLEALDNVEVVWIYHQDDELLRERGLEIKSVVNLPFKFEVYKKK